MTAKADDVAALVALARRPHHYDEDSYLSCPEAPGGNGWGYEGCRCGADEHNAKVDAIAARLGGVTT